MQATENNKEEIVDEEHKSLSILKIKMRQMKDEDVLNNQSEAMLTQVIDDDSSYYEQYTIYPLYEKNQIKLQLCYIKC